MAGRHRTDRTRFKYPLQPRQVEAFRTVVQTGSMTAAADTLNVTQPAISRLIRDFELAVGFKLFQRQGTHLVATSEALFLLSEVERCFIGLDKLARAAEDIRNLQTGRLNIAATPALSSTSLAKAIARLRTERGNVSISIQSYQSLVICEMVSRHQVDIGVGVSPRDYPGVIWEPLPPLFAVCAVPRTHALAGRTVIDVSDVANEQFIVRSGPSQLRARIDSMLAASGTRSKPLMECSLTSTMCALVAEGVGLSIVDPFTARDFRSDGIVCLPFQPALSYDCSVIFPDNKPRPQLADAFARTLSAVIAEDFGGWRP